MAKFLIVAAAALQIVGVDGTAQAGEQLGVIETDCDIASLVSALNYGGATVQQVRKKAAAKTETVEEQTDQMAEETETASETAPKRTRRT